MASVAMHEERRRAGRGERGGELAPDVARLADAADDHAPAAVQDQLDRVDEGVAQPRRQRGDRAWLRSASTCARAARARLRRRRAVRPRRARSSSEPCCSSPKYNRWPHGAIRCLMMTRAPGLPAPANDRIRCRTHSCSSSRCSRRPSSSSSCAGSCACPRSSATSCVGIAVGTACARAGCPIDDTTRYVGEFGVVFLMFSIGLEFSLPQLRAMRRAVFGLGLAQVAITTVGRDDRAALRGLRLAGGPGAGRRAGDELDGDRVEDARRAHGARHARTAATSWASCCSRISRWSRS